MTFLLIFEFCSCTNTVLFIFFLLQSAKVGILKEILILRVLLQVKQSWLVDCFAHLFYTKNSLYLVYSYGGGHGYKISVIGLLAVQSWISIWII